MSVTGMFAATRLRIVFSLASKRNSFPPATIRVQAWPQVLPESTSRLMNIYLRKFGLYLVCGFGLLFMSASIHTK